MEPISGSGQAATGVSPHCPHEDCFTLKNCKYPRLTRAAPQQKIRK